MKKTLLLLCLFAGIFLAASAQQNEGTDYRTALGFKFYPAGVTIKHFLGRRTAAEAIGYSHDGFRFTVLIEYYIPIGKAPGLNAYIGPGMHLGFHDENWEDKHPGMKNKTAIGVDGVVGLDYKLKGVPLNLSLDWQPSYNLAGENYFESGWGGVAIRYAF
ncbi:MAG: hypothetical protein EOO16_10105 [Chitinophagaceae bacterium]|nr:MAG: hypothetical protein EOO16_10105 [Chitinophagaceae bacterium]